MKIYFHDSEMSYDGSQLKSHFAYENFNIMGDSIVAFIGPCSVRDQMVDLEDVKSGKFIHSQKMLHFIAEHFEFNLLTTVACQRLLTDLIIQELNALKPPSPGPSGHPLPLKWEREINGRANFVRRGDDIFDQHFKLSVSIATCSPVSCLIHTGINIVSAGTPVPTQGLEDYRLNPHAVATGVLNRYRTEIEDMRRALTKVRACP